jgi:hypothetical protein
MKRKAAIIVVFLFWIIVLGGCSIAKSDTGFEGFTYGMTKEEVGDKCYETGYLISYSNEEESDVYSYENEQAAIVAEFNQLSFNSGEYVYATFHFDNDSLYKIVVNMSSPEIDKNIYDQLLNSFVEQFGEPEEIEAKYTTSRFMYGGNEISLSYTESKEVNFIIVRYGKLEP